MNPPSTQPEHTDPRHQRLDDLLIEQALSGLAPAEQQELELLAASLGRPTDESFESAAAAFDLAFASERPQAAMPADLHERLLLKGQAWARAQRDGASDGRTADGFDRSIPGVLRLVEAKPGDAHELGRIRVMRRAWQTAPVWGGWLAAAASLLIALDLSGQRRSPSQAFTALREGQRDGGLASLVARSPLALFDQFTSSARDSVSVHVACVKAGSVPDTKAEVVWSPSQRTGFLKVAGLPANNTSQSRYQIWVVDATRTDAFPVDAGLFDIPHSGGCYVVPINARLPIGQPRAFAVTLESPMGAVVSKPDRVILAGEMTMGPPEHPSSDPASDRDDDTPDAAAGAAQ